MNQTKSGTVEQAHLQDSLSEVELSQGTIQYSDIGEGEPIVFVHGALVNGNLWRNVAGPLSRERRCLVPTLPLGGHEVAMHPDADLTPPDVAALLSEFIDALGLERVTLIGNDSGGAFCQVFLAEYPERVERLILTNCDAFDSFPPLLARPFVWGARVPGFTTLLARTLGSKIARRLTFKLFAKHSISPNILAGYLDSLCTDPAIRRDLRKALLGASPQYTNAAAQTFSSFDRPVLVVWGFDDPIFPFKDAERLVECFPNARLERIEDSHLLVPEDQPERLVERIAEFLDIKITA
ncbi:alpha/beta fold hydrolase [Natrinema marinum]|uniref:alpha/beta fold hydrolase n=1 Tax=Natrinema marinum TaxID=2961598 RepID=UPI0020C8EE05|nr:alpha/beta hydrolase [Natrinema marinum]